MQPHAIAAGEGRTSEGLGRRWPRGVTARRAACALGIALVAAVVLAGVVAQLSGRTEIPTLFRSGDTAGLVSGADVARSCLSRRELISCAYPAPPLTVGPLSAPMSGVDRYALLLYLPSIGLRAAGASRSVTLWGIAAANALGLLLLLFAPWMVRRSAPGVHRRRFLWVLVIVAGPLLPYGLSTWSEVLAAALVAGAVLAVAARWPWWAVVVLVFGAGISKETMAPLVVVLCLAVVSAWPRTASGRLAIAAPVLLGATSAVVANAAFNAFRYGSAQNENYLAEFFRVHDPWAILAQLASVGVAPNGGVAVFWPTAVVAVALICLAARGGGRSCWLRLGLVGAAFIGHAVQLAMWFSPFGWYAWGPRLMLPIVPAVILAGLTIVGEREGPWATRPARVALILATVASLPNVAVLRAQAVVNEFMSAPSACPQPGADPFVPCVLDRAWGPPWLPLEVLPGFGDLRTASLGALVVAGAVLALRAIVRADADEVPRRTTHPRAESSETLPLRGT